MVKIERLSEVVIFVPNLHDAIRAWGDLFETRFVTKLVRQEVGGAINKVSLSPIGIELVERQSPPLDVCGLGGLRLKVKSFSQAFEEMTKKGFPLLARGKPHGSEGAAFDVRGVRVVLVG